MEEPGSDKTFIEVRKSTSDSNKVYYYEKFGDDIFRRFTKDYYDKTIRMYKDIATEIKYDDKGEICYMSYYFDHSKFRKETGLNSSSKSYTDKEGHTHISIGLKKKSGCLSILFIFLVIVSMVIVLT